MATSRRYSPAIERRILAAFYRANIYDLNEGMTWYARAYDIATAMSNAHGVTLEQSAGVIAALSPGLLWRLNVEHAEWLIEAWQSGLRGKRLPIVGVYGYRNVRKCIQILSGSSPLEVLGGKKVRSFYANILEPTTSVSVTVDRHAKCACYGLKNADNSVVRDSEYEYLAEHFRRAARRVSEPGNDILPHQVQATAWVVWRRLNGNLDQYDLFGKVEEIS